jgi:hypothetical protein
LHLRLLHPQCDVQLAPASWQPFRFANVATSRSGTQIKARINLAVAI